MAVSKAQRQAHGKRAAIYARVSDKSQDGEEKTSISEQINDMEAHCKRKGLTITARYQEVGRGWSKKRPEFQRMLADAKRGRFDTIVCWKSDRLSRGMYPAAALMEVVEANHINLEAVMDAIDMKTFGLMAAIGKIELDNFRERASMGKRGTAKQGRIPVGNIPYGYRIGDDGRPQIVEAEAEVVRRVYRMCVNDGLGAYLIARQLNLEGGVRSRALAIGIELVAVSASVGCFGGARAGRRQGGHPRPPVGAWESLGRWWCRTRGQKKAGVSKLPPSHGRSCCQGEPGILIHRSKQFVCRGLQGVKGRAGSGDSGRWITGRKSRSGSPQPHGSKRSVGAFGAAFETRPRPDLMLYPCTGVCVSCINTSLGGFERETGRK